MLPSRLLRALRRFVLRAIPPRFHTRKMAAGARVLALSPSQRELLAANLRRMLSPKAA